MRRLLALAPVSALLAACGPSYDGDALATAVGRSFAHLYARSAAQDGRVDVRADDLQAGARCARGGEETPDEGPGDDWRCVVAVSDPQLGRRQVVYEVVLKPDGCFSAEGPPEVVGDPRVRGADGVLRLNPVYAFDGCL